VGSSTLLETYLVGAFEPLPDFIEPELAQTVRGEGAGAQPGAVTEIDLGRAAALNPSGEPVEGHAGWP
jgi:hypothetical protein